MRHKAVFLALLLISSALTVGLFFYSKAKGMEVSDKIVTASPKTIWVPDNYTTIQEAINVAEEGDTIYVRAGIYYEKIVINKNDLTLIGENKDTTIIDGNWTETVIKITANNVSVSGFTMRKGHYGIYLDESLCSVYDNVVTSNTEVGIYADSPGNHTIMRNNVKDNPDGILLVDYNIVARNTIENNTSGIRVSGDNNVISENNVTLHKSGAGITIGLYHKFNTIIYNNLTKNRAGVLLDYGSEENRIIGNTIASNWELGIYQSGSRNNIIHHNNVINNTIQVYSVFGPNTNTWDNGAEGNYWSDYNGTDINQDGIGDTPHVIDGNNQDNYPLMGMFFSFNTSLGYYVNVISNSTIEDFQYFDYNSTIKMYVSNMTVNQTYGFCRICIPHCLMNEPYNVTINGANPVYWNYSVYDNGTHRWIYFAYEHSTLEIVIVPEFPSALMPLLVIIALVAVVLRKTFWTQIEEKNNPIYFGN